MPNGMFKPGGEDLHLGGLAVGRHPSEHFDIPRAGFGQEDIAVGRGAHQPGIVKSRCVERYFEPVRRLRPGLFRARNNFRSAGCRWRREGWRKVFNRDVVDALRAFRNGNR